MNNVSFCCQLSLNEKEKRNSKDRGILWMSQAPMRGLHFCESCHSQQLNFIQKSPLSTNLIFWNNNKRTTIFPKMHNESIRTKTISNPGPCGLWGAFPNGLYGFVSPCVTWRACWNWENWGCMCYVKAEINNENKKIESKRVMFVGGFDVFPLQLGNLGM